MLTESHKTKSLLSKFPGNFKFPAMEFLIIGINVRLHYITQITEIKLTQKMVQSLKCFTKYFRPKYSRNCIAVSVQYLQELGCLSADRAVGTEEWSGAAVQCVSGSDRTTTGFVLENISVERSSCRT